MVFLTLIRSQTGLLVTQGRGPGSIPAFFLALMRRYWDCRYHGRIQ